MGTLSFLGLMMSETSSESSCLLCCSCFGCIDLILE